MNKVLLTIKRTEHSMIITQYKLKRESYLRIFTGLSPGYLSKQQQSWSFSSFFYKGKGLFLNNYYNIILITILECKSRMLILDSEKQGNFMILAITTPFVDIKDFIMQLFCSCLFLFPFRFSMHTQFTPQLHPALIT